MLLSQDAVEALDSNLSLLATQAFLLIEVSMLFLLLLLLFRSSTCFTRDFKNVRHLGLFWVEEEAEEGVEDSGEGEKGNDENVFRVCGDNDVGVNDREPSSIKEEDERNEELEQTEPTVLLVERVGE